MLSIFNSLPTLYAIKAMSASDMMEKPTVIFLGIIPKTEGPINKRHQLNTHATLGTLNNLITFAMINPVNKITEICKIAYA